jgi:hypothetical protein
LNSVWNKKWRAVLLLIALLGGYFAIKSLYSVANNMVGNASEWVWDWYNWSDYKDLPA